MDRRDEEKLEGLEVHIAERYKEIRECMKRNSDRLTLQWDDYVLGKHYNHIISSDTFGESSRLKHEYRLLDQIKRARAKWLGEHAPISSDLLRKLEFGSSALSHIYFGYERDVETNEQYDLTKGEYRWLVATFSQREECLLDKCKFWRYELEALEAQSRSLCVNIETRKPPKAPIPLVGKLFPRDIAGIIWSYIGEEGYLRPREAYNEFFADEIYPAISPQEMFARLYRTHLENEEWVCCSVKEVVRIMERQRVQLQRSDCICGRDTGCFLFRTNKCGKRSLLLQSVVDQIKDYKDKKAKRYKLKRRLSYESKGFQLSPAELKGKSRFGGHNLRKRIRVQKYPK